MHSVLLAAGKNGPADDAIFYHFSSFKLHFNLLSISSQEVKEKRDVIDELEHKKTSDALPSSARIDFMNYTL